MGNGLWLAHQDRAGFGWLTKPGKMFGINKTSPSVLEFCFCVAIMCGGVILRRTQMTTQILTGFCVLVICICLGLGSVNAP